MMHKNAPRFVAGGILFFAVGFILQEVGSLTWATLASFVIGLLLFGRGFLGVVINPSGNNSLILVNTITEVPLLFDPSVTSIKIQGQGKSLTSVAKIDDIPIMSPGNDSPSLSIAAEQNCTTVSLLSISRLSETRFELLAQSWTKEAVVRYTGEVEQQEIIHLLEQIHKDLLGEANDTRWSSTGQ